MASAVLSCGYNWFRQLGPATADDTPDQDKDKQQGGGVCRSVRTLPKQVDLQDWEGEIAEVAAGQTHSIARSKSGQVLLWGFFNGIPYPSPTLLTMRIPLPCIQIACGKKHTLALLEGGFVTSFGCGYFGQLGHGDNISYKDPCLILRLDPQRIDDKAVQVSAGAFHSAALMESGRIFQWGFNRYGQCGNGHKENTISSPLPVCLDHLAAPGSDMGKPVSVCCGRHHSALLTSTGRVYSWGSAMFGKLGQADPSKLVLKPQEVRAFSSKPVRAIAGGDFHMLAVTVDGRCYSWGHGGCGQCGHGVLLHVRQPRCIEALRGVSIKEVVCGTWWSMAVTDDGSVYAWGSADGGWTGLDQPVAPQVLQTDSPQSRCSDSVCLFDSSHNELVPTLVKSLAPYVVSQVACGAGHSLAIATLREPSGKSKDGSGGI
ncbi:unnamed protein product [Chrysoparadoxa australica]